MDLLDNVQLTPLKIIPNSKGDIMHGLKVSSPGYVSFGEAYFSHVNFGEIKGWKKHHLMTLNLVVPVGEVKFVLYDSRAGINTLGHFFETILSKENYQRLTVPPGVWMAFQGIGRMENLVLNLASIEHNPDEAETKDLTSIDYLW